MQNSQKAEKQDTFCFVLDIETALCQFLDVKQDVLKKTKHKPKLLFSWKQFLSACQEEVHCSCKKKRPEDQIDNYKNKQAGGEGSTNQCRQ